MLSAALRLLAVGQAKRRMSAYVRDLTKKYSILAVAAVILTAALVFVLLAAFWALAGYFHNYPAAAVIMAVVLAVIGVVLVYSAQNPEQSTAEPLRQKQSTSPMGVLSGEGLAQMTGPEIGRQIEQAVRDYGPLRVVGLAAAGGVVLSIIAKRYRRY